MKRGQGMQALEWHDMSILKKLEKRPIFVEKQVFLPLDGGDKRDRTADLLNAIQALSQLSYTPESYFSERQI